MREQHIIGMKAQLRTFLKSIGRSLSDMAIRYEAKEWQTDARSQALNILRRIGWSGMKIVQSRRYRGIIYRNRTAAVRPAPGKTENQTAPQLIEPQQGCPLKVQGL